MIDLLLLVAFVTILILRIFRGTEWTRFCALMVAASFVCHALCLLALYLRAPAYEYVVYPSPASQAGLRGGGSVQSVDGEAVGSAGSFLARVFSGREARIAASREFQWKYPAPERWRFWLALDSHALEEACGGLALFPRRPLYRGNADVLNLQVDSAQRNSLRIIAAGEFPTPTIGAFLSAAGSMPNDGILTLRYMRPSTDSGVVALYFSPSILPPVKEDPNPSLEDRLQAGLGFSGLEVVAKYSEKGNWWVGNARRFDFPPFFGPAGFAERTVEFAEKWESFSSHAALMVLPRLSLLPWIGPHPILSWPLGGAGTYLRQLLSLRHIPDLFTYWEYFPKQYYAADDALSWASAFFKVSSLTASLAIGIFVWGLSLRKQRLARAWRNRRGVFVFVVVLCLQLLDLFVIRTF